MVHTIDEEKQKVGREKREKIRLAGYAIPQNYYEIQEKLVEEFNYFVVKIENIMSQYKRNHDSWNE